MATKKVNADLEVTGEVSAAGENLSQKVEYLEYLVPEAPLTLEGLEFENVSGGVQSAGLADDGVVDHYAYNLSPGDVGVGNIIRDSLPIILTFILSSRVTPSSCTPDIEMLGTRRYHVLSLT